MALDRIELDKQSPVPLAEQLAGSILRQILAGTLPPGDKLPAERDLAETLGISRGTVKRAYARLEQSRAVEIRQGSGTYVMANGRVLEESQRRDAADLIVATLSRLQAIGLSEREIRNMINLYLTTNESPRKLAMIVLSNNHEILAELEKQLSYLTRTSQFSFTLSFMTMGGLQNGESPAEMLYGYDLIIATSIDYAEVLDMAPMYRHKIIEAGLSPRTSTLIELSSVPRDRRVGVVYRTPVFRELVVKALHAVGFVDAGIVCWSEEAYHPSLHVDGYFGAVVGFNEAPMFMDPTYREAIDAFAAGGGKVVRFEYRIDRGSLTLIEDRIQELLVQE